jgi:hypothetical protein
MSGFIPHVASVTAKDQSFEISLGIVLVVAIAKSWLRFGFLSVRFVSGHGEGVFLTAKR